MCSSRHLRPLALLLLPLALAACGKKGNPYPPPSKVPAPIPNLRARQVGDQLVLRMSYPTVTLGGLPIEGGIETLEVFWMRVPVVLRPTVAVTPAEEATPEDAEADAAAQPEEPSVEAPAEKSGEETAEEEEEEETTSPGSREAGEDPLPAVDPAVFASASELTAELSGDRLAAAVAGDEIVVSLPLPPPPEPEEEAQAAAPTEQIGDAEESEDGAVVQPVGEHVYMSVYAVRTRVPRRKPSPLSNLARIVFQEAPPTPSGVRLTPGQDGIEVTWQSDEAGGKRFNVYRRRPGATDFGEPLGRARVTDENVYLDETAVFGRSYEYSVTAVSSGTPPVQSPFAPAAAIDYEDRFPPDAPTDLVALVERGRIRLLWSPVDAPDLLGYRIYRSADGGDEQRLNDDPVTTVDWSDSDVVAGGAYTYRVTALDREGNEGPPSEAVLATAR